MLYMKHKQCQKQNYLHNLYLIGTDETVLLTPQNNDSLFGPENRAHFVIELQPPKIIKYKFTGLHNHFNLITHLYYPVP